MVKGIEVPIPEEMMTCPDCQGPLVLLPEGEMLFVKGRVASIKHTLRCTKCKAEHTHYVDEPEVYVGEPEGTSVNPETVN